MVSHLKVGGIRPYQLYREVEPVPPYPRVEPQWSKDEYPRQQQEQRDDGSEHARRRFEAMRRLIDALSTNGEIARVDHLTAVNELTALGFSILENELLPQLLAFHFPPADISTLLEQIAQHGISSELQSGVYLTENRHLFPVFIDGLHEYNLVFPPLSISAPEQKIPLLKTIKEQGYAVSGTNHLQLDFRNAETTSSDGLVVTINVLVGVSEIDDDGRRVILYDHSDRGYSLYADKQIDLSI